jgi:predicted RNA polymerase sigma factor
VAAETDWAEIHALYRVHEVVAPSPLVTLNRAVALAKLEGPEAGLALAEGLRASGVLASNHRLASVCAHLLEETGRATEAQEEYLLAAEQTTSPAERAYLLARAESLRVPR